MRRLLLLTIVAAVPLSNVIPSPLVARAPSQGQACSSSAMIGTWELTTKPRTPGVVRALKHVTPTHFFVVRLAGNDVVLSGHGGPYSVANGTYTETITHGFGGSFEEFRGVSVSSSRCEIVGDVLHVMGEYRGVTLDERWRKLAAGQ